MEAPALIQVKDLRKAFDGVEALKSINLGIRPGEFHALLGENGAGKSTLIKIITGVYPASGGDVRWQGRTVEFSSPQAARALGIGVVHQEEALIPGLSIAENFALGERPPMRLGWVSWSRVIDDVGATLRAAGITIDPGTAVGALSVAERKRVAILRTLAADPELLILDEPTAALTSDEADQLMNLLADLKQAGKAILYVTHRLPEIERLVDFVTVLKDGNQQATLPREAATPARIVSLMVGRAVDDIFPPPAGSTGGRALSVERLGRDGEFDDVDMIVNHGEIVGLVGLEGHGHFQLARALFGSPPAQRGRVLIDGRPATIANPRDAIRAGLGLVSEDRIREGVLSNLSVRENLGLAVLRRWARFSVIRRGHEEQGITKLIALLGIKAPSREALIETLSGGNQQKVVLARWFATAVRILILLDPTAGVDVGARVEIYKALRDMAKHGSALVVATSDLSEALGLCDRIYVFYRGRVVREVQRSQYSERHVLAAMTGHTVVDR